MNAPNVRSATVRLNAEVAKYMADMKAAGKATDQAFDSAHVKASRLNQDVGKLSAATRDYSAGTRVAARDTATLGTSMQQTGNAIDRTSGRLALLLKAVASVGPALGPIGAVGIAGVAGLASQLGFAAVGITSLVVASQGVGDALKAVETARLEPTVKNLQAARDAMDQLGPDARDFVTRLQELRPVFTGIRNQAAAGWFPGLTEALDHFEDVAPRVGDIFQAVGQAGGELVADAAQALAGPEWADFLSFIQDEAPAALEDLGRTAGNIVHGMGELWMAFSPVNNDFSDWLLDMSRSFDDWSAGLSQTGGFQEFVTYLSETGPKVAAAAGAIADALIQIAQAAAPIGGPVLDALTGLARAIALLADSPLGTPLLGVATALSAISLATRGLSGLAGIVGSLERLGPAASRAQTGLAGIASKATPILAVSAAIVALGDALGDAMGANLNLSDLDRDLQAIADGATSDALSGIVDDLERLNDALPGQNTIGEGVNEAVTLGGLLGNTSLDNTIDDIEAVDQALANLVESGKADQAYKILQNIGAASIGLGPGASLNQDVWKSLLSDFDAYATAADNAAAANGPYDESLRDVGDAAGLTRGQIRGLTTAMLEQANAALSAFDAVTQYREALKAARAQADRNNAGIDGNSKAALENRNVISQLAGAWNIQSAAVRNNVDKYREARTSFLDVAQAMGIPIERAIRLADRLLAIPRKTTVGLHAEDRATAKITAIQRLVDYYGLTRAAAQALLKDLAAGKIKNVQQLVDKYGLTKAEARALLQDAASGKLEGLLALLRQADGYHAKSSTTHTITTVLRTEHEQAGGANQPGDHSGGAPDLRGGADGMTVPGPRQPYGDKLIIGAAPGEEVISNRFGQADRHRPLLKAINAGLFADGGTVGGRDLLLTRGGNSRADEEVRKETEHRKRLNSQLKEATKAVAEERKERDRLVDRMGEIRSGLTDSLTSELGADSGGDPWSDGAAGGTLSGNLALIKGDTREARRVRRLVQILKDKGFDGAAFEDLLARGDINEIQSYASGSRGDLRRLEQAFAERAREIRVVSRQGADAALKGELREANQELREATSELRQIKNHVKQANQDRKEEHQKDRDADRRGRGDERRDGRGKR